ncbi:DUF1059 domain-containing protein [Candidatus Daviesbacteria bacterium]|nr:DUF1059 domain-containing protein [Candidatus Daviesbacteria bacterium]
MDNQKTFECSDDDFMVRGKDMEEIKNIARMHIKDKHGMDISEEDLKAKIIES